jgi:hypothetical protein
MGLFSIFWRRGRRSRIAASTAPGAACAALSRGPPGRHAGENDATRVTGLDKLVTSGSNPVHKKGGDAPHKNTADAREQRRARKGNERESFHGDVTS